VATLTIGLTACDATFSDQDTERKEAAIEVEIDPYFREFYNLLGGADVLGPAISPRFSKDNREYQYTAAVLMVSDPQHSKSPQYYLAPIGVEMGIRQPISSPDTPGGHAVFSGFQAFYDQLGGTDVVGVPLSEVRYNPERRRIEQYFENMGFYQLESDPPGVVHLLHYGAWLCSSACGYSSPEEAKPSPASIVETPFSEALSRLNPSLLGQPLTEPYTAPDGTLEQIYDNVVVVSDPERPGGISLRPITAMLGLPVNLGGKYEIPDVFRDYLQQNSGLELSGPAVSAFERQSNGVYRQCFTNLCLEYDPDQPSELQVRPVALGGDYKQRFYQEWVTETATVTPSNDSAVTLKVSKGYGVVTSSDTQIISVWVYKNQQPLAGVEPIIELVSPDGDIKIYRFPATRSDGFTSMMIEPIDGALHWGQVKYQVCVVLADEPVCVNDQYLLWTNP